MAYQLILNKPGLVADTATGAEVSLLSPVVQAWIAEGNQLLPVSMGNWEGLYADTINPAKLLTVFQRIKAVSKVNLAVNASFTALIPTLTITRLESALAVAIQELAEDLAAAGEPLTAPEKSLWNASLSAHGFSDTAKLD